VSGRGSRPGARCQGSEGEDDGAPVGVADSTVVAVDVACGVSAGLVPPGLGLPSSGVGLPSSGVGEAEAVAVEVGVAVGGCATATAAPTTVSRAAAAQMIWARRRKLATIRRRSAAMERDYRPRGRWRRVTTLRRVVPRCPARPRLLPMADRDCDRRGAHHLDFAHKGRKGQCLQSSPQRTTRCRSQLAGSPPSRATSPGPRWRMRVSASRTGHHVLERVDRHRHRGQRSSTRVRVHVATHGDRTPERLVPTA
jgi:hypothetical protein